MNTNGPSATMSRSHNHERRVRNAVLPHFYTTDSQLMCFYCIVMPPFTSHANRQSEGIPTQMLHLQQQAEVMTMDAG
jgi:hypothetical protein